MLTATGRPVHSRAFTQELYYTTPARNRQSKLPYTVQNVSGRSAAALIGALHRFAGALVSGAGRKYGILSNARLAGRTAARGGLLDDIAEQFAPAPDCEKGKFR